MGASPPPHRQGASPNRSAPQSRKERGGSAGVSPLRCRTAAEDKPVRRWGRPGRRRCRGTGGATRRPPPSATQHKEARRWGMPIWTGRSQTTEHSCKRDGQKGGGGARPERASATRGAPINGAQCASPGGGTEPRERRPRGQQRAERVLSKPPQRPHLGGSSWPGQTR